MCKQLFRYHLGNRHQCKKPKRTRVRIGKPDEMQQPNKQTRESNIKLVGGSNNINTKQKQIIPQVVSEQLSAHFLLTFVLRYVGFSDFGNILLSNYLKKNNQLRLKVYSMCHRIKRIPATGILAAGFWSYIWNLD